MVASYRVTSFPEVSLHRETGLRTFADEVVGDDPGRTGDWKGSRVDRLRSRRRDRGGSPLLGRGHKAYPPLLMMKAMLLQHLRDLGDPKLEERLSNDLLLKCTVCNIVRALKLADAPARA